MIFQNVPMLLYPKRLYFSTLTISICFFFHSFSVSHLGAFTQTTASQCKSTCNRWRHHHNFPIFHMAEMLLLCDTLLKLKKLHECVVKCLYVKLVYVPPQNKRVFVRVCVRDPPLRANVVELFSSIATLAVWQK